MKESQKKNAIFLKKLEQRKLVCSVASAFFVSQYSLKKIVLSANKRKKKQRLWMQNFKQNWRKKNNGKFTLSKNGLRS